MSDTDPQHDPAQPEVGEEPTAAALGTRCISVLVAGGLYGLAMDDVQEVIALPPMTRVFHAPSAIAGVVSLRGEILPIVDLRVLLGERESASRSADTARVIVVREEDGAKRRAGLLVDELRGIRDLPEGELDPVPATVSAAASQLVTGVLAEPPPCSMIGVTKIFESAEVMPMARSPAGDVGRR